MSEYYGLRIIRRSRRIDVIDFIKIACEYIELRYPEMIAWLVVDNQIDHFYYSSHTLQESACYLVFSHTADATMFKMVFAGQLEEEQPNFKFRSLYPWWKF